MPRPNPPRKRPRRRPGAARADAELTRQTAQSTRPQQPGSKPPSGGSGGRGGGAAAAVASPEEMWSRRSYAILIATMGVTQSVISLLLLGLQQGSKSSADFVAALIGVNPYQPITLAAAALLAAPVAKRLSGETRPLRFVETLVIPLTAYLIFNVLGIAAGLLLSAGSPAGSTGSGPTPLPNGTSSPSGISQTSAPASSAASPSASPSQTATSSPSPTSTPATTSPPVASGGSQGNAVAFTVDVPSAISSGQQFSILVRAVDSHGHGAQNFSDVITLASSDGLAAIPATYAFVTIDSSAHTFQITLNTVGSQTITVTDQSVATIKGTSAKIAVAGAATKLVLAPTSPIAAQEQGSVKVTVEDKSDRRVTDYTGTVAFSSTDATASLPRQYTFTSGDCGAGNSAFDCGQHTFKLTFNTSGSQTVSAKDVQAELSGTSPTATVTLSIAVFLAASAVLLLLSYTATLFVYPPLYKRLRTRPRPPAQGGRGRDGGNKADSRGRAT